MAVCTQRLEPVRDRIEHDQARRMPSPGQNQKKIGKLASTASRRARSSVTRGVCTWSQNKATCIKHLGSSASIVWGVLGSGKLCLTCAGSWRVWVSIPARHHHSPRLRVEKARSARSARSIFVHRLRRHGDDLLAIRMREAVEGDVTIRAVAFHGHHGHRAVEVLAVQPRQG